MRRRKHNFRFHLGVLGALTAVPFILAGAVLAALYVESERGAIELDLVSAARDLSNAIDRQIDGGLVTLRTLAFAKTLEVRDLGSFYSQAARVAGIFPDSVVTLRRPDGQQIVNTSFAFGSALPQSLDPVLRASDDKALKSGQPVVSNIYASAATGQHYVMLELPITFDGAPHLLGLALPPESILRLTEQSSAVRPDWMVIVLDGNHRVLARTRDHNGFVYSRYVTPPIWRLRNDALALSRRERVTSFNTGITELNAVSDTLANASASLRRDEEAKSQMIKELNHRVKNSLATVLSIARQSAAKTDNFAEFYDAFSGRLVALSQSHDALSEGEWVEADAGELVERVCVSVAGRDRIAAKGPSAPLYPRAALTLGMVLHELCTNAAKYGALARPAGKIAIEWSVLPHAPGGASFALDWIEQGGPPVEAPQKKSFGTRFITESIRHELKGAADFDFRPEGLHFRCRFPLRRPDAKPAA